MLKPRTSGAKSEWPSRCNAFAIARFLVRAHYAPVQQPLSLPRQKYISELGSLIKLEKLTQRHLPVPSVIFLKKSEKARNFASIFQLQSPMSRLVSETERKPTTYLGASMIVLCPRQIRCSLIHQTLKNSPLETGGKYVESSITQSFISRLC